MPALDEVVGNCEPEGEITTLEPVSRKAGLSRIELDEVERQVVYGRPEMINNLSSENGNLGRGTDQKINCLFSVRILNDFIRVCSGGDSGNNTVDCAQVFGCPDKF